ncbi:MAG: hypothetical protein HC897_03310 [Thermoanaerobaculia bacterium]|nr:hypothetical protein [Thermoanaerobaculia bacterium]
MAFSCYWLRRPPPEVFFTGAAPGFFLLANACRRAMILAPTLASDNLIRPAG